VIVNANNFLSIEIARQAALEAAQRIDDDEALRYRLSTRIGRDTVEGLYEHGNGDHYWHEVGVDLIAD